MPLIRNLGIRQRAKVLNKTIKKQKLSSKTAGLTKGKGAERASSVKGRTKDQGEVKGKDLENEKKVQDKKQKLEKEQQEQESSESEENEEEQQNSKGESDFEQEEDFSEDSEQDEINPEELKSKVIEQLSDSDFADNDDQEEDNDDENDTIQEEQVKETKKPAQQQEKQEKKKTKKSKESSDKIKPETSEVTENAGQQAKEIVNRSHLSKYWSVCLQQSSMYTGGRIEIAQNEEFLAAIANYRVNIVSLTTREITSVISHDEEELCNFSIHPSSKFMATFTRNNMLRFVNLETKEVVHSWKIGDQWALDIVFDPTGQFMAIACVDGFVKVYDVRKGNLTHNYKVHRGSVTKLLFHPTPLKLHLISVGEDYAIRIYDLVVSAVLKSIVAHTEMVTSIAFSEDGSNLISAASDKKIIIWDYASMVKQAEILFDEQVEAMGYLRIKTKPGKHKHRQETYIAATGSSGVIKLIDISSNEVAIHPFPELKTHEILKIITLPKHEQICAVTVEQNIVFYNFIEGPKLVESDILVGFNDEITDAKFCKKTKKDSPDFDKTQEYVIVSTNSTLIKAVELGNGKSHFIKGHSDFVLTVDTYGPFVVSAGKDKTIKLWKKQDDSFEFKLLATFIGHIEAISSVCFGGKTGKVFASGSEDQNLKIWEVGNLQARAHKITNPENVTSSKRTVAAHTKDINVVRFSPNEKLLASAAQDRQIKIWDAETLACKMILKGHKRGVWDVNFSPIEKLLASGSGDSTVKVWNLEDGQCVHTFEGHMGSVLKVQWVCFGLEIISGGADGLVKVWNVKKQTCLNTINKHSGKVYALDISTYDSQGKQFMLTGANDSNLFLWQDVTQEEELKKKEAEHEVLIQQDNFASLFRAKDYINAVKLAFKFNFVSKFHTSLEQLFLQRDFKNANVFSESDQQHSDDNAEFEAAISDLVANLVALDINKLLIYIRDLNAMQKSAKVAQRLLNYVIKSIPLDDFLQISKNFKAIKKPTKSGDKNASDKSNNAIPNSSDKSEFDQLLDALTSYSKRHAERMERFIKKSYYLDFVLKKIDLLAENSNDNDNKIAEENEGLAFSASE